MERAAYDTIMLDNAVRLARDWAAARGDDTLILVVADHNHPISLIGTIDDDMTKRRRRRCATASASTTKRASRTTPSADKEGYPAQVDVSRRLAIFSASSPDYYETFRPKLDDPNDPTVTGVDAGTYEPNERYRDRRRRDAAARQPAEISQCQRPLRRGRDPDRERPRQRAGPRLDGQHRGVPGHGRGRWALGSPAAGLTADLERTVIERRGPDQVSRLGVYAWTPLDLA